jgi:hypothetical protein
MACLAAVEDRCHQLCVEEVVSKYLGAKDRGLKKEGQKGI